MLHPTPKPRLLPQDAVSALEAGKSQSESEAPLQGQLEDAATDAAAQKVANDATIAALTQEAQALKTRNNAQGTRIKELKAELKERKAALKEGDATAEFPPGLRSLKKTSTLPKPCAPIWSRSAMSCTPTWRASAKTTKGPRLSLPPPPPSLGLPKA